MHHETRTFESGNCSIDDLQIVHATKSNLLSKSNTVDPVIDMGEFENEDGLDDLPSYDTLSRFVTDVVTYIAGYIFKKLTQRQGCQICLGHIKSIVDRPQPLVDQRNRGSLYKASPDCVRICRTAESIFRENKHLITRKDFENFIATKTYFRVVNHVFQTDVMKRHTDSQPPFENHHQLLIKTIASIYAKIRANHALRLNNEKEKYVRQKLTKYIHFIHQ